MNEIDKGKVEETETHRTGAENQGVHLICGAAKATLKNLNQHLRVKLRTC